MSTPNVAFAPAELGDVEAIAAMADAISRRHYLPDVLSEAELACFGPLAYAPEVLSAQMQAGVRFEWILLEGLRVGFLAYAERDGGERLNLGKLYLDPSCHGQGIGQVALRRVQTIAEQQGVREVYLYVFRKNNKALRAYLRAGFVIDRAEVTPCYNGFCFDDYVMVYRLADDKR
ncbi:MAG: N-acetyltransferase [Methylococcus sp.]|nr:MAG: N-acetyltransferase [Methylococcus sp.]